jgi:hypothetical protein
LLAEVIHQLRPVSAGVLLVEDGLLGETEPAAAVLLRPAETGPAVLGEVTVPGEAFLTHVLAGARAAHAPQVRPLAREMLVEPGAYLVAEGIVVCAHMR